MSRPRSPCALLVFLHLVLTYTSLAVTASDETAAKAQTSIYRLRSSVIGAAGIPGESAGFRTKGTLAQSTPLGEGGIGEGPLYPGFWKPFLMVATTIEDIPPGSFVNRLFQNFPNPFNPRTAISYSVAGKSTVEITIYDPRGRLIRTLVQGRVEPGLHKAVWDGRDDAGHKVSSGVYFYRLAVGSYASVMKMLMLK